MNMETDMRGDGNDESFAKAPVRIRLRNVSLSLQDGFKSG